MECEGFGSRVAEMEAGIEKAAGQRWRARFGTSREGRTGGGEKEE